MIIGERTGISPSGLALKGCILFHSDFAVIFWTLVNFVANTASF